MNDIADARLRSHLEALFREELQDNLAVLADGLRELQDPVDDDVTAAVVQDLFRAAHSLKGAAHSAGVTAAVSPCRRLEEGLAAVRSGETVVDDDFLVSFGHHVAALAEVSERLSEARPGTQALAAEPESRTRVAVRALDDLMHQTAGLASATDQLRVLNEYLEILQETTHGPLGGIIADFKNLERTLGRAVGQISATAQRLRMEPVEDVTAGVDHVIEELCRATGKQAALVLEGGDVELDRDVADAIREPLLHLVRNAVDHGIEHAADRAAAGKPLQGTVSVSAALDGARVCIRVADDGRGIDAGSLRTAAGAVDPTADANELAFLPGLSTAPAVTDVSGRGVGLDAVRARVESLGGSVKLNSSPGAGTEVVVHVPTSLAVLRVILVRVGGELVALPVAALRRLERAAAGQVRRAGRDLTFVAEGAAARAAVDLGATLGFTERDAVGRPMTVVELAGEDTVLLADAVESDREALLQPLPPRARGSRVLLGAILLPQDRVAVVVNPATCIRAGKSL